MDYNRSYNRVLRVIKILVFVLIGGALFVALTMYLWNQLAVPIFGLPVLNFFQTLGLILLFGLLTGGIGAGRGFRRGRHYGPPGALYKRWKTMSEEERRAFRERCRPGRERREEQQAGEEDLI